MDRNGLQEKSPSEVYMICEDVTNIEPKTPEVLATDSETTCTTMKKV